MDRMIRGILRFSALCVCILLVSGCAAGKLAGAMLAADEAQKKIEVKARYSGLQDKTCAVLVESDAFTIYQYPQVPEIISSGVTARLHRDVLGTRFLSPQAVIDWQF